MNGTKKGAMTYRDGKPVRVGDFAQAKPISSRGHVVGLVTSINVPTEKEDHPRARMAWPEHYSVAPAEGICHESISNVSGDFYPREAELVLAASQAAR